MRSPLLALAAVLTLSPPGPGSVARAEPASPAERAETERRERQRELDAIQADLAKSQAERSRIEAEVTALRNDRAALVAASLDAVRRCAPARSG